MGPSSLLSSLGKFYNPGLAFGWEDEEGGGGEQRRAMQARQVGSIGDESLNSLTAIGGHDCQLFNKLHSTVISCRIFIRSQSLIAH